MFKSKRSIIELLTIVFVVSIIIANTIVGKTWKPFPGINFEVTAAFLFFIFPMIVGDILAEVLPKRDFNKVILYGFGANLLMAIVYTLVTIIPNPDSFVMDAYNLVLGQSLLVFIASMTGYLLGSYTNALIFWALKAKHGENNFKLRAWVSTILGQIVDNFFFGIIALYFAFKMPFEVVLIIFISETVLEIIIETLFLPITHALVKRYRKLPEVLV